MELLGQKIAGVVLILIGLIMIKMEHDGTVALMTVPFGLFLIFTKQKMTD